MCVIVCVSESVSVCVCVFVSYRSVSQLPQNGLTI